MSDTTGRERSRIVVIAVLATIALALAATLVVRGADNRPRADVGEVLLGPLDANRDAQRTEVLLPWGRVEVAISDPVEELPHPNSSDPAPLRPPSGGSFIRVDVRPTQDGQIPLIAMGTQLVSSAQAVLRVNGDEYPLMPPSLSLDPSPTVLGGSAWVAVDGKPEDASLAITVDGETQVIADGEVSAGRAGELATAPSIDEIVSVPGTECGRPVRITTDGLTLRNMPLVKCLLKRSIRTPYVDGLGWAAEGRDFLVLHLATDTSALQAVDQSSASWRERNQRVEVTLDGAPSLGKVRVNALRAGLALQDLDDPMQYVFDVPRDTAADEVEIVARFDAEPASPFVSDRHPVRLEWRMPAGDPAGDPR